MDSASKNSTSHHDILSSPKPLIAPSKLFLTTEAEEQLDWSGFENCHPNFFTPNEGNTPFATTETKRRKSLIPAYSPLPGDSSLRRPSSVLSASGTRSSKSRRISNDISDILSSRQSSGRKSVLVDREIVDLREINNKQALDIQELHTQMSALRLKAEESDNTILDLQREVKEKDAVITALTEENAAFRFFAQIQGQKIEEQETMIMTAQIDHRDDLSSKNRKYKAMVKKLQSERAAYEQNANTIVQQLNEQMAQLQKFALTRIETLEKQLIESRRAHEEQQKQVSSLKLMLAEQTQLMQQQQQQQHHHHHHAASASARDRSRSPVPMTRIHNPVPNHTPQQQQQVEQEDFDEEEEEEEETNSGSRRNSTQSCDTEGTEISSPPPSSSSSQRSAKNTTPTSAGRKKEEKMNETLCRIAFDYSNEDTAL